jgi:phosphatidylserine/phosphatidylglycerophosphate/cardiolipin synthase-like enzyme
LTGYDAAIGAILQSVERSTAGDAVLLRSYVIEDGRSSRAVLAALSRAADRGVRVTLGLDRTLLSSFTRAVEGTTSLLPEVLALAHRKANISLEAAGERPDHSKVFLRHSDNHDECEGVMGGVNLGGADVDTRGS